jgi:5'(3')-deoxyribonucleotidase
MRKLTILTDWDDVLNDLLKKWIETLNSKYLTDVPYLRIRSWDIVSYFPQLTKEQVFAPIFEAAFWQSLTPEPNSAEVLRWLVEEGHAVYIVTASYHEVLPSKMAWLAQHYPWVERKNVILCHNKQMIQGDVLIDDGVHNLEGGEYKKILYSRPHNFGYIASSNDMTRVFGWHEVYNVIQNIARGGVQ